MSIATIPARMLAAVAPFMAYKDVRYYLNGLLLEPGRVRAIATDGNILGHCTDAAASWDGTASVILPRQLVLDVLKAAKGDASVTLSFGAGHAVSAQVGSATLTSTCVDGKFPEWRQLFGGGRPEARASFNPELLAQIVAAHKGVYKHCGGNSRNGAMQLVPRGESAAAWMLGGLIEGLAVCGVVMPLRATWKRNPLDAVAALSEALL